MRDDGHAQDALDWYARGIRQLGTVLERDPQNAFARDSLREAYEGRAQALTSLVRHSEALPDWDSALALASGADHDRLRLARAATLARMGQHGQATAEAKAVTEKPDAPDEMVYAAARTFALAAAAVAKDGNLAAGESDRLRKQYSMRSIELLRKVQQAGYFKTAANLDSLQKDKDFDAIRADREFVELMVQAQK